MTNESFNVLRPDTRELTERFDELRRTDQRWAMRDYALKAFESIKSGPEKAKLIVASESAAKK